MASTASATMASSATATDKKSWPCAASYWAWHPRWCSHSQLKFRTTVNDAKNSPGFHFASVRFAAVAKWYCWKRWQPEDARQSRTHHEQHKQTHQILPAARLVLPTLQGTPVSCFPDSSLRTSIQPASRISTCPNSQINQRQLHYIHLPRASSSFFKALQTIQCP